MNSSLRLFVALPLPEQAVEQLALTQRTVAEMARLSEIRLRLTRSDQLHLTLAFLGEVLATQVQSIIDATRDVAKSHSSCQLVPGELVAFPSRRKARVVAVSFEDRSGTLARLATSLHSRLRECGCTLESRPFRAHVTLARLPFAGKIELDKMGGDLPTAPISCGKIRVFQSILSARGSEYRVLGWAELKDS